MEESNILFFTLNVKNWTGTCVYNKTYVNTINRQPRFYNFGPKTELCEAEIITISISANGSYIFFFLTPRNILSIFVKSLNINGLLKYF